MDDINNDQKEISEEFLRMCTFSDNPLVQEYCVQMKGTYHDSNIMLAIEKFAAWVQENEIAKLKAGYETERDQAKQLHEYQIENMDRIRTLYAAINQIDDITREILAIKKSKDESK